MRSRAPMNAKQGVLGAVRERVLLCVFFYFFAARGARGGLDLPAASQTLNDAAVRSEHDDRRARS